MQSFNNQFMKSNLTYFQISQNGNQVDGIDANASEKTSFVVEASILTFLMGEGHREFQIDIYGLDSSSENILSGTPLAAQSAKVPYEERGSYSFSANFQISIQKDIKYLGLDLFFKVERMSGTGLSYEPVFRTLVPISSGEQHEE